MRLIAHVVIINSWFLNKSVYIQLHHECHSNNNVITITTRTAGEIPNFPI